jgi:periplasmic protein TonB
MIGGAAADRTRRRVAGASVLIAHALLLWVALEQRSAHSLQEPLAETLIVASMFELPPTSANLPDPAPLDHPRLLDFAPQEFAVEPVEIQVPEVQVSESPSVVAAEMRGAPAAGPRQAGESSGQASGGSALLLLQRALPAYPRAAARRGEQGVTQAILHVRPDGRVDEVKVERSSGSQLLDAAAVEAFRRWRFERLADSPSGRWLRTAQRFILYQFTYSRLDAAAVEFVYSENLKPKPGAGEDSTPGSEQALLRFMAQLSDPAFDARGAVSRRELTGLRANFAKWGATKSVAFMGIVGSGPWLKADTNPAMSGGRETVELSWNMFEVRHENATSQWLIAMDRDGQVWAARVGQTSWVNAEHG